MSMRRSVTPWKTSVAGATRNRAPPPTSHSHSAMKSRSSTRSLVQSFVSGSPARSSTRHTWQSCQERRSKSDSVYALANATPRSRLLTATLPEHLVERARNPDDVVERPRAAVDCHDEELAGDACALRLRRHRRNDEAPGRIVVREPRQLDARTIGCESEHGRGISICDD